MKLTEAQKNRIEEIRSKDLVMLDTQYGAYVKLSAVITKELIPNEEGFEVIVKALYTKQEFKRIICTDLDLWLDGFKLMTHWTKDTGVVVKKSEFVPVHKDMSVKNEDLHLVKKDEFKISGTSRVIEKKNPNKLTQILNQALDKPLHPAIQANIDKVYNLIKDSKYGVLIYLAIYEKMYTTHDNLRFYLDELMRTERLFKHNKLEIYAVDKKYLENELNFIDSADIESVLKKDNYHRTSPIHSFTKEQCIEINEKRKTMLTKDIAAEYKLSVGQLNTLLRLAVKNKWIEYQDMRKVSTDNPKVNRAKLSNRFIKDKIDKAKIVCGPEAIVPKPFAEAELSLALKKERQLLLERNPTLSVCQGLSDKTRIFAVQKLLEDKQAFIKMRTETVERLNKRIEEIDNDIKILDPNGTLSRTV